MFEFTDLDSMSRLLLLKKQKEAKDYWRSVFRLKGAFIAWGAQTTELIQQYKLAGGASDLTKAMSQVAIRGEITIKRLENQIKKIDDYLKDIDARLGDGTRWYNAIEIQEMFASIEGVTNEDTSS